MKKGKLIVVEGASDGVGKTTQINKLYDRLVADGEIIFTHHFPSLGTVQGGPVGKFLAGEYGNVEDLSPYFVNGLYAIDRAVTWNTILKKEYEKGKVLLLDRYTTSSIIYQAAVIDDVEERKKFIDYIVDFEYKRLGIKEPDMVIFLVAPFDLITEIRNKRKMQDGEEKDIYERDLNILHKIYDNAVFVANYLGWKIINCNDGNKMKSIDEIHEEIYNVVKK